MKQPPQPEGDRALRALVARCEAAWNAGDAHAWAANMAEDVYLTSVLGDRYHGRDLLESGHRYVFDTIYKDSKIALTVEAIRFVRPDVALVHLHQRLMSRLPPGAAASTARQRLMSEEMHETQARASLLVVKDGGSWQVLSFQNTGIASPKGT
ncbi:MAG: SgcJ/EcaC family oxidoreductase [Alphaproteobacteria bacterium]|nr:SgcJ/EcaC family oxidoreductase [Alphaproteobacteria bacterium]